ncbi:MAG: S8 family serine peptidase [Chitinophagales bacterium]|nr:S8 family serine peptidase [Chitinophagales bacterium]
MPITFDWSKTIAELPGSPVPADWLAANGDGVKVAYIDRGVNLGLASLEHVNQPGAKFFTGAPGFSVAKLTGQDLVGEAFGTEGRGHGTLYASLLVGKIPAVPPADKDLVNGLANGAKYFIIKARNANDKKTTAKNILDAIELAGNLKADIVILGQSISKAQLPFEGLNMAAVDRVFNLPSVQRMFIFAPLKNLEPSDPWANIASDNIPNLRTEVFNVARLPVNFESVSSVITPQNISFMLAGFSGKLLTKNGDAADMEFSNSGAVAIMGGVAVLALSHFKKQNGGATPTRQQFAQLLGACCSPLQNASGSQTDPAFFRNF